MNHIKNLGLGFTITKNTVTLPSRPTRRVSIAPKPKVRPSENPDPAVQHRAGGLIGELSAGAVMVDHATRELAQMGLFRHEAKQALGLLKAQADKLVTAMQDQFDFEDSDATNALSTALGVAAEKFCQLTPAQMDAALQHMDGMIRLNIAYVPAPTPTTKELR